MDKETLMNSMNSLDGIQGCILVSKDGLVLSSSMPDSVDSDLFGAVLSSMNTNIDVQSKRMQRGEVKRFAIETENEVMIVSEVKVDEQNALAFCQFKKDTDIENTIDKISLLAE